MGKTAVQAQSATNASSASVTFYSGGSLLKTGLPETKSAVFEGCIFDADQSLGCISYRGFMTVTVTPGKHVFSASLSSRHPAKNSQMEITLEAGKNYYVRAVGENSAFKHVIGSRQGQLEVVNCQVAHDETKDSGEVKEKSMSPYHKKPVLSEIPPCASTP
jgi:hypothetical protein